MANGGGWGRVFFQTVKKIIFMDVGLTTYVEIRNLNSVLFSAT